MKKSKARGGSTLQNFGLGHSMWLLKQWIANFSFRWANIREICITRCFHSRSMHRRDRDNGYAAKTSKRAHCLRKPNKGRTLKA